MSVSVNAVQQQIHTDTPMDIIEKTIGHSTKYYRKPGGYILVDVWIRAPKCPETTWRDRMPFILN